jgi:hypothetical protein
VRELFLHFLYVPYCALQREIEAGNVMKENERSNTSDVTIHVATSLTKSCVASRVHTCHLA